MQNGEVMVNLIVCLSLEEIVLRVTTWRMSEAMCLYESLVFYVKNDDDEKLNGEVSRTSLCSRRNRTKP